MKIDRDAIKERYELVKDALDERQRRLWAGAEAAALGYGGIAAVSDATGIAKSTIGKGRDEAGGWQARPDDLVVARRRGAGPKRREDKDPQLVKMLEELVEADTRGDPEAPLRWTCKSTRALARALSAKHGRISPQKVGRLLADRGYSLQAPSKTLEGANHPDRNAQFEFINRRSKKFIEAGVPVLSVDSKKKELVGEFKTGGREWRRKKTPIKVQTHDFIDRAVGKAIPYGVYDIVENCGMVNVGVDHDTPTFAVRSIELWWERFGSKKYAKAKELYVTADAGGSNSYRSRCWKSELQRLADALDLTIYVSHFPPGTSKWNKIEHRLFSFITLNWRGRPLSSYETIIKLISTTTTTNNLRVEAALDLENYPLGATISDQQMKTLALQPDTFHGEWNYSVRPRTLDERKQAELAKHKKTKSSMRKGRHAKWRVLQAKIKASGLSVAEYCRRNGLSYGAVRTQRRRLKVEDHSTD